MKPSRGLSQLTSSIKLTVVLWERIPERLLLQNGKGRRTSNQDTLQKKIEDHWIGAFFCPVLGKTSRRRGDQSLITCQKKLETLIMYSSQN